MIDRISFDKRFKTLCLLTKTSDTSELYDAYFQKLRYFNYQDFDYACRLIEENDTKITLQAFLKYVQESKSRYKTKLIDHNDMEGIVNCNHQCKTCCLEENQSCKELTLAILCYTKQVMLKKMTMTEASMQLRNDFPKMSFPVLGDI